MSARPAARAARPSRTLGRRTLLERLGAGGMGEVWRARGLRPNPSQRMRVWARGIISHPDSITAPFGAPASVRIR